MCRGFQPDERDRLLRIKSFYLHLSLNSKSPKPLPDSLTLHYLPRINGGALEINDSGIRPDAPAFVTLHRVVAEGAGAGMYGSRERVRVSEGVRFEVYLREEKVVKGGFGKDGGGEWRMECKCGLEAATGVVEEVKEVEVCVAAEGEAEVMREKVGMLVRRRCFRGSLEEIPEQLSEGEEAEAVVEGGRCCCCECRGEEAEEGGGGEAEVVEMEVEGVRWAVDVGIWAVCLGVGVGYLVSSKTLRRRILF